ncbi:MAG: CHASE2 domain-containing protein, partial [Phormidium sp.]
EQSELNAYDHLLRSRPAETMDERLLLVEITEDDVQSQPASERGDASLSDRALERLLSILEEHKPRVVGLQVIRESESERPALQRLMQRENFFHICSFPMKDNTTGVPPAPEVADTNFGFTNLLTDKPDSSIRRHLLALTSPGKNCPTNNSFVFILIKKYLEKQNIAINYDTMKETHELAGIPLQLLDSNSGGYHDFDSGGFQMMINYRNTEKISNKLKLNDILGGDFDPGFIRDKIVMIGTTATSFKDHNKKTPYYSRWGMISGLEVQAHTVSQMLSAILDARPLIRWLSLPQVILWTWVWSLIGGLSAWRLRSPLPLGLATTVGIIVLLSFCHFFLIQGVWLPLIPAALTLLIAGVTVAVFFLNRTIQRFFEV